MEIEELMIGDWVELLCADRSIIPIRITEIHENILCGKSTFGSHWGNINDIMPIPVTLDILEKNGFVGDTNVSKFECRDDSNHLNWRIKYCYTWSYTEIINRASPISVKAKVECRYVHQLQQAMRLCGINKEIIVEE